MNNRILRLIGILVILSNFFILNASAQTLPPGVVYVAGDWWVNDGPFHGSWVHVSQSEDGQILSLSGDAYSRFWGWDDPTGWERSDSDWVCSDYSTGQYTWYSTFLGRYGYGRPEHYGPYYVEGSVSFSAQSEFSATYQLVVPGGFYRFADHYDENGNFIPGLGGPLERRSWGPLVTTPPEVLSVLATPTTLFLKNTGPSSGITFKATTNKPATVYFKVKKLPDGPEMNIGTAGAGATLLADFFWQPDSSTISTGSYSVIAWTPETPNKPKSAAFEVKKKTIEVVSVTPYPSTLWLDEAGAGSGIVFKALTTEPDSDEQYTVSFDLVTPDGVTLSAGTEGLSQKNGEWFAKKSWWGQGATASGSYKIIATCEGSFKESSFTVVKVEGSSLGMGNWMLTNNKDPSAKLPPSPKPISCPKPWPELITGKPGTNFSFPVGDPVNIVFGNYILPEIDLSLKARFPLVLARFYNSLDSSVGLFGRGWSSPYSARLEFVASDVVFVNSDGSRLLFSGQTGNYQAPETSELKIALATDTGFWRVYHPDGSEWVFETQGKIIRMSRACCGRGADDTLLFDYDTSGRLQRVTGPDGQYLEFAYTPVNLVSVVTDSSGRTVSFGYTPQNFLTSFTDPIGRVTQYAYTDEGFLTTVTRPGNRVTSISYLDQRVSSVVEPNGATSNFVWDFDAKKLILTDFNGTVHEYAFDSEWRLKSYSVPSEGIVKQFSVANKFLSGLRNSLGNSSSYSYNSDGLVNSITDLSGNMTFYEWHPTFHKLTKTTDALNRVWVYNWCYRGNLISEVNPAGGVTSYTYDIYNNRTGKTDPLGRVTRFIYGPSGNYLMQVIDPQGGISSFSYDIRGNLISSSDPLARTTLFYYDLLDRLVKTVYPDGRFVEVEYDDAGNVMVKRDNLGRETRYSYNLANRLTVLTRPDSTTFKYTYNSTGQKITEEDPLGRITRFEYSPTGLLTRTVYPDGAFETLAYDTESRLTSRTNELDQTASLEYDPMGRLLAKVDPSGARWESQYDAVGRKTAEKDSLNRITAFQFDNLDRITKIIRPDNSFVMNSFDSVGNLLSTIDGLGNQWSWAYDSQDRQVRSVQPNGASSATSFDAASQVIAETDALNKTTLYSFDLGGRKTAVTDALNNIWQNFYDGAGRLIATKNPMGAVSSLSYDIMDRVISQSDALGNTQSFEFDAAGRRVAKVDAQGRRSITVFDLRDRVQSEVDPEGHTVSYGYNLAGQRVSLTDGANRTWRWEFDNLGRVVAEYDPLGNVNRYGFDAVGNRIFWTNARNQTTIYTFSEMNRLSQISYPDGTLATIAYDLEGRELSRSGSSGSVMKTWDSVGNLTSESFGPWGKKWQYFFDLVGNRVQAIDPEGQVFKYRWDALNRMVQLDPPDRGDEITYSFDAAGRPIGETRPGVKTTNTFDAAGRLLEMKHERDHGKEKIVASRKYTYSAVGNRLSQTDENGEKTLYSFNNSDWLTKAVYPDGKTVSYGYNGAGDRIEEKSETPTVKGHGRNKVIGTDTVVIPMTYDAGGRLVSKASDTFVFDNDGNQVSAVENGDESRYFWSPDNRLVKVERDIECHRHGKRRCHQCPQTLTLSESYTYESESWRRLTRKTDEAEMVSVYDGNDESGEYLVKKIGHGHGWKCDKHKSCKCPAPKPEKKLELVRQFIGGPGPDDLELTRYHGRKVWTLKDALGSTIALTNRGGNTVARVNFDAWGNFRWPDKPGHGVAPCREDELDDILDRFDGGRAFGFEHDDIRFGRHVGKIINPHLFAGRRLDGFTGQYFNRNRYYQPKTGRFTSRDKLGFGGGLNLWAYADCNPPSFVDPFGLKKLFAWLNRVSSQDEYLYLRPSISMRKGEVIPIRFNQRTGQPIEYEVWHYFDMVYDEYLIENWAFIQWEIDDCMYENYKEKITEKGISGSGVPIKSSVTGSEFRNPNFNGLWALHLHYKQPIYFQDWLPRGNYSIGAPFPHGERSPSDVEATSRYVREDSAGLQKQCADREAALGEKAIP